MWLELLVAVATLAAVLIAWGRHDATSGNLGHLPGPSWVMPLVGEMSSFVSDPMQFAYSRYRAYGPVFRSRLFGQTMVVVGDEKLLRGPLSSGTDVTSTVPIKTFAKIVDVYNMKDPVRHKLFRKNTALSLTPANIKGRLDLFIEVMEDHVKAMMEAGEFELDDRMRRMVVTLALGPIAGFKLERDDWDRLLTSAMVVQGGLFAPPIDLPGTDWHKALKARPGYIELLKKAVRSRFEVDEATSQVVLRSRPMAGGEGTLDPTLMLIQEFIDANDPPTLDKLAERLVQNVLGASETTFGMMLALICIILMMPDLQDKLRAEQRQVLGQHGPKLGYDVVMQHMPLLDAVVRETMRVAPSSHGVFRDVHADLDLNGYHVPKGSMVLVSLDLLYCLDPKVTDLATKSPEGRFPAACDVNRLKSSFKPERWLKDPSSTPTLHAFSFGPHACLGMNVAMLEAKLVVATMLRAGTWQLLNKDPRLVFFPWTRLAKGPARVRCTPAPLTPA